jgi:transposase
MRALEREVVDAVYAAIEPLLPEPPVHPLGCHRPRVPDRLVFWGILIRLTTGASWVDIEASSNTGSLTPRCEPVAMSGSLRGCFHQLRAEALHRYCRA